jgi:transposase-like protein
VDDLSRFCCLNPNCPDHGLRGHGNLTACMRYGPQRQYRLLYCKTCKDRFGERKGTPLFDARLPKDKILAILAHLADGCGIRQTARLVGVNKDTVTRLALKAGDHARQLHDELVAFSPSNHRGPTRRKVVLRREKAEEL